MQGCLGYLWIRQTSQLFKYMCLHVINLYDQTQLTLYNLNSKPLCKGKVYNCSWNEKKIVVVHTKYDKKKTGQYIVLLQFRRGEKAATHLVRQTSVNSCGSDDFLMLICICTLYRKSSHNTDFSITRFLKKHQSSHRTVGPLYSTFF